MLFLISEKLSSPIPPSMLTASAPPPMMRRPRPMPLLIFLRPSLPRLSLLHPLILLILPSHRNNAPISFSVHISRTIIRRVRVNFFFFPAGPAVVSVVSVVVVVFSFFGSVVGVSF